MKTGSTLPLNISTNTNDCFNIRQDGAETLDRILTLYIHDNGALENDGQPCDSNGTGMIGRPRRSEGDGCDASKLQGMMFWKYPSLLLLW